MSTFHTSKIIDYRQETANTVSIAFDVDFTLFSFIPGQYIDIDVTLNGQQYRRAYSICSAPNSNELRIAVKETENGTVSAYLNNQVQVGDELSISTPQGNFTHITNPNNQNHYMLFGAGSGITPLISIIKATLKDEPNSKVSLFFGNRNANSIIFRDELDQLVNNHSNFQTIHLLTDNSLEKPLLCGRIDFERAMQLIDMYGQDSLQKEFFTCGPAEMMHAVEKAAQASGFEDKNIHKEYFVVPVENDEQEVVGNIEADFEGVSQVEVTLDDDVFEFEVPTKGKSILQYCIDEDVDPPYSCRGGICVSCMAKVEEGKVVMDNNNALSQKELDEGYILTCQAHPASKKVKITFDD